MKNELNLFREKLKNGECVYGPFMKTADPMFVEVVGHSGFDFAILDMEHGPVSLENQQNNIRAAGFTGIIPIVRVKDMNENTIGSVLDIGAQGIQVPQVKSAEDAKAVVSNARFYPCGMRGVCRFVRAAEYSNMDRFEYFKASENLIIIIQLEGVDAIKNIDDILSVEGIDILFIGPYDLSQSLGVPGEVNHPKVIKEMNKLVSKAKAKNKVIGTFVDDINTLKMWRDAGVQYLSYNVDVGIFSETCKQIVREMKE